MTSHAPTEGAVVAVRGRPLFATAVSALVRAEGWTVCAGGEARPTVEIREADSLPPGPIGPGEGPAVPVLAVDHDADPDRLVRAIEAGATGYTTTLVEPTEFLEVLATVSIGQASIPPELLGGMLRTLIERRRTADQVRDRVRALTSREHDTLAAIVSGLTVEEMAAQAFVAESTVRTHVQSVLRKFEVHSQVEVAALVRGNLAPAEVDELTADVGSTP